MLDFLIGKTVSKGTQKFIDRQDPKVNIQISGEIPIPSITYLKKAAPVISKVNGFEDALSKLTDEQLKSKTKEFKEIYEKGLLAEKEGLKRLQEEFKNVKTEEEKGNLTLQAEEAEEKLVKARKVVLDQILPEAFAVVREAGKRVLGMRHFDVQLVGGMVLHDGNIAEMTTGEGKTLVATLPAYLNALTGEGVHVVTVNDYLAKRDREWMGPIYEFLGLTVGVIQHDMDARARQQAYSCDITYGTNNEFGFDYLRDNMVNFKEEMVQRGHHFAIVDEVDSILVDEARTPLIISGPAEASTDTYYKACEIAKKLTGRRITEKDEIDAKYKEIDLTKGFDYMADEKLKSISLTEEGEIKIAQYFGVANIHDMETIEYRHHILQALRAKEFFKLDVDYVARDGEVIIVDEFTGRMMPGRRWSDGLHQAVEAKEGIKIERENQTLATITFQNYFRLYEKLSGMTGTAYTEAVEFKQIYDLDCVAVPTNKVVRRQNYPDAIYRSFKEKYNAIIEEVAECYKKGQPVLLGTISIEKSETLSRMLHQKGIPHQVLNAKFHELEAHIIAQAGRYKAVTIATNMAGRGTDIVLGGNADYLAKSLAEQKLKDVKDENERHDMLKKFLEQFRKQVKEEHDKVIEAGGLHVLGSERHESRRIDNQLRGRQGRQGDPGSSRFYVSLEDDLMRLFASDRIIGVMDKLGMEEGQVLEHPWLTRALETAQKRVETHNFEIRKHLIEFDDVMNKQREVIYSLRREILESENLKPMVIDAIGQLVSGTIAQYSKADDEGAMDLEGLELHLKTKFNISLGVPKEKLVEMSKENIEEMILNGLLKFYEDKEKQMEPQAIRFFERMVLLNTIDSKWKDHLYAMDQLKEGVGLRSYGQRNPLMEYKKEGFAMFEMMYGSIYSDVAELALTMQPAASPNRPRGVFSALPKRLIHDEVSGMSAPIQPLEAPQNMFPGGQQRSTRPAASSPVEKSGPKVGRNDPCPCGSGKKYKKCCGRDS